MKTVAIVQARMGSTRFPNKVLAPIGGAPLIELLLDRLDQARRVDQIVVAIPRGDTNLSLADCVGRLGHTVFRGDENDVLDRYHHAAKAVEAEVVVRITADCPLIDPRVVDAVIGAFQDAKVDYASNTNPPSFPDGLDTEVFSFAALDEAWRDAKSPEDREHVTSYITDSGRFRLLNVPHAENCSDGRWTVDEPEDLEVIRNVIEHFHPRRDFDWLEVLKLSRVKPGLFAANRHLARNVGAEIGSGQKLWARARQVIPGGGHLLSKRPELFLPNRWPAYFSRAKDCRVWDLDGREYIDMAHMNVGANTLGYGHPEVDEAVRRAIEAGNMSTLNCPEEVKLAERLVALHPWADMVRLARTGGEANAIAIRIARAASGRDQVAVCGYHGWHDWYLAANLGDEENLAGHLLPGLEPAGVPKALAGTVWPFSYNHYDKLETLVREHDIGVVKMEVMRNEEPRDDFLQKVRALTRGKGIVLIFDECTSGFRQTFGGLHRQFGVEPDMAVFGKALGNGYAISAVIGRREIMEAAQGTFISSTFWTERIGPAAALKTLEVMEREKSWEQIGATSEIIRQRWRELADGHHLEIHIGGAPGIPSFDFPGGQNLEYKTLITQEMLARGYLAATSLYASIAHTGAVVDDYCEALDPILGLIRECGDGRDVKELLQGPVCQDGFRRLN